MIIFFALLALWSGILFGCFLARWMTHPPNWLCFGAGMSTLTISLVAFHNTGGDHHYHWWIQAMRVVVLTSFTAYMVRDRPYKRRKEDRHG